MIVLISIRLFQKYYHMEEPKFTSIQPNLTGNIAKHSKIAKRIVECVAGRSSHKKQLTLGRRHVDKYLYTFAMEIGSDLPNDEILKTIFFLLIGSEENSSLNQKIEEEKFYILISVCLNIY